MSTTTTRTGTIAGVFANRTDAQKAVRELIASGFDDSQIGVISHDVHEIHTSGLNAAPSGTEAESGAAAGAAVGLGVGALWGLGILAGILPGIGPAIAGGTLGVLLSSAAVGAAAVGLAGTLVGLGIPEDDAVYYEEEFKSGRTLVTVKAGLRADTAWSIMARCGAYER